MDAKIVKQELDRTAQCLTVAIEENESQKKLIARLRGQLTKALEEVARLTK